MAGNKVNDGGVMQESGFPRIGGRSVEQPTLKEVTASNKSRSTANSGKTRNHNMGGSLFVPFIAQALMRHMTHQAVPMMHHSSYPFVCVRA